MEQIVQGFRFEPVMIEGFREYLYDREHAPSTIRKYVTDIRTFCGHLESEGYVDKRVLLEYKGRLMEEYASSSVNSMLVALNQFLDFLNMGRLKVKGIKVQKQMFMDREKEMTKAEYERLRDTAKRNNKVQLSLEIETLAATGARVSELASFTIERIRRGKIEIMNKGKFRILLIPEGLRKKLLYYASKRKILSGPVFVTASGKPKDRSNIWREMKGLEKAAGVKWDKIFPHNLRHLFARTYYKITRDLAGLADLLGHSSMDVTRIYTAVTGDTLRGQIERIGLLAKEG